jgi:hypothetical protein
VFSLSVSSRSKIAVLCLVVLAFGGGCRRLRGGRAAYVPPLPPPFEVWKPGAWRSFKGATAKPPEVTEHPWRVLMLQQDPRPKKNPRWQTIPITESGLLEMPAGTSFLCLYNPVLFRATTDEHMMAVAKWDMLRTVRCTTDGWHTYSEAVHSVAVSPDGQTVTKSVDQTELYLHDTLHGKPLEMTVILRSD